MSQGQQLNVAPGSTVVIRDEEWLVTSVEKTGDDQLVTVQGLSPLVRGTTATFYESLEFDKARPSDSGNGIRSLDPRDAVPVADDSPHYRRSRLWLEATLRKTPVPIGESALAVSHRALADTLDYQYRAVAKALDPANLQPRILLADTVGLGKTIEIGMILSELIRRGRGERILIVCPRHVLEQTQNEMWSRFDIPFVRLDSVGVQRVKQKLPANRNPFTFFKRVIISMDTLKQDHFVNDLRKHHWNAVVIDESHNVTNASTQNNALARNLAATTDALILASATPHNGRKESFAELVRLLEPTAVSPDGEINEDDLRRLVIRRHRNSPEVAGVVGSDWAERLPPRNELVPASPAEDAVACELNDVWLHPAGGSSPYSGSTQLFPWTLAKAFLSSPAALDASITERRRRLDAAARATAAGTMSPAQRAEADALDRLAALNERTRDSSAKYDRLVDYLRHIGVGRRSETRAVVFAERVATLTWLQQKLTADFGFKPEQVALLHGGLPDVDQQEIVESFKQTNSPIRVLVTGDVASEGVNLHQQCHELIHFDIPWSLIRIEQRNGRIDRYGQRSRPQITTLLLSPSAEGFSGDIAVLSRLLKREEEAHRALGDVAGLMGEYSESREEAELTRVLAGQKSFDEVVRTADQVMGGDGLAALMAAISGNGAPAAGRELSAVELAEASPLYAEPVTFLREALEEYYTTPAAKPAASGSGGVGWREYPGEGVVEFTPPADLRQRLEVLPQGYLSERGVLDGFKLATSEARAAQLLRDALTDASDSSWPEAHYLGPLHPVLDWAADRALAMLGRNEVYVVRGRVDNPTVLLCGTLTDRRGQVVTVSWVGVEFPSPANPAMALPTLYDSSSQMLRAAGLSEQMSNPGAVTGTDALKELIAPAVEAAERQMDLTMSQARQAVAGRIDRWNEQNTQWRDEADAMITRGSLRQRRAGVEERQRLVEQMAPDRRLVRPLLVVVPADYDKEN
ncbi:helicase-related protein [Propionibacterium australiense]|uniref:DEAD/DEAH box helicase n=1 Tax=Propionibacterium australiense TaxID=119981 RepID=A0A383SAS1_9ACTN|nr:helicase-related protein [Propionibacterium australiense]RLP06069.1 DEAD/DEAH box helicase [Propionibacterium australiense]RLP06849.1 DEAD/DEAH box helicase [Propionibacterium australiense]SYZ34652.1 RNA helicase [Propionibacterium australiense]VEH89971.1 RNA polymerase-associated protein rapA [Propionibacterium australiense]